MNQQIGGGLLAFGQLGCGAPATPTNHTELVRSSNRLAQGPVWSACVCHVCVCVVNERCVWRLLWRCGVAGLQRHPDADLGRLGEGRPAPKRLRAAGDLLDVPSGTASDGVVTNALRARPTLMADGQDSTNVGRRVCGCVCARGRQSNHFSHAWRASEFRASYEPVECSCLRL